MFLFNALTVTVQWIDVLLLITVIPFLERCNFKDVQQQFIADVMGKGGGGGGGENLVLGFFFFFESNVLM